ncbi:iron ABC transporter permease [Puia sp.]|jgi:iron complex transport system permease protein|uniref:iron ABC transporter permease n=1 Tax=Puia sp. TaxID=2045100 RepID=UPI002F4193AC
MSIALKGRFVGLFLLLLLALLLDLSAGAVRIPLREVFHILFSSSTGDETWRYIIDKIRVPKACTAVLAGCGLSVGGLQMQTMFRNPLADPGVLGITAGASLGVAAVMLAGGGTATLYAIKELGVGGSWLVTCAACAGAALAMFFVLMLSGRVRDNVTMLIIGLMISSITIAITSIWQYFSNPEEVKEYLLWAFGSLGGVTGSQLPIFTGMILTGLIMAFFSSKRLDALLLGENYARSMGLTVERARFIIVCSTSLLVGSITAFCGPIGFLGIAVPHLARGAFNTASHRILMPASCLIGTILLLLCDSIAQWPGNQTVLPINIITSLVGAPVVIYLLLRTKNLKVY